MRRVAKKRVKSWVHKTFLCSLRPWWPWHHRFWPNDTKLRSSLPRIRAEFFAGSAHLTEEPAAKGYNVLEPRGVLLGHNLFEPLQQETVFNDINYKKPKLFWVALPGTKWSQWQRLKYARRRQALRRARAEQRRLIHFAVECAWDQIANGNEVMFEHPKYSDLWIDRSM